MTSPAALKPDKGLCGRLRALREWRAWSLSKAASEIGCTKAHLWQLEDGRADNPGIKLLTAISAAYEAPVYWIIGEKPVHFQLFRRDETTHIATEIRP